MLTMLQRSVLPFLTATFLLLALIPYTSTAQRNITYMDLIRRSESPNIYTTEMTLPGEPGKNSAQNFIISYRIKNSFLTYKKRNSPGYSEARSGDNGQTGSERDNYFAPIEVGLEVFHYEKDIPGNPKKKRKQLQDVELNKLKPASRNFVKDTAYTKSYNHTTAADLFVNGSLDVDLAPGNYIYVFTIGQGGKDKPDYKIQKLVRVTPMGTDSSQAAFFTRTMSEGKGELLNIGDRILYGQDFYTTIHLPEYDPEKDYHFKVHKLSVERDDTTRQSTQFDKILDEKEIGHNLRPSYSIEEGQPFIRFEETGNGQGYTFAHIKVPGSTFPNTFYSISLFEADKDKPIYKNTVQSLWIDMPKSLLNINVALEMLRFIVPEEELDKLKQGSFEKKREKFNKFWAEKDPTPSTQYNELMDEYYKRIDYAFREFGSMRVPGYRTDQGKVYIQYGEPADKKRTFPSDGRSIEVWEYPGKNLKFVFKASTGFGDYKLVNKESLN